MIGYWIQVDGMPVHVNGDPDAGPEARAAIEAVVRAAAARKEAPAPFEEEAAELNRELDRLDLATSEAHRRFPQFGLTIISRMRHGAADPSPLLAAIREAEHA